MIHNLLLGLPYVLNLSVHLVHFHNEWEEWIILRPFSCKDTALQLQVLMSVCMFVCGQPENLPSYILLQHPECSRMFQNACRMFQNVPECIQNVPECMQNVPEGKQIVPKCMQIVPECMQSVPECSKMHADLWACMQVHELACNYISSHTVT